MTIYDLTCIKNDVCNAQICDHQHCKNRADNIEVMKHSLQQLKSEIAALIPAIIESYINMRDQQFNFCIEKLRQKTAV